MPSLFKEIFSGKTGGDKSGGDNKLKRERDDSGSSGKTDILREKAEGRNKLRKIGPGDKSNSGIEKNQEGISARERNPERFDRNLQNFNDFLRQREAEKSKASTEQRTEKTERKPNQKSEVSEAWDAKVKEFDEKAEASGKKYEARLADALTDYKPEPKRKMTDEQRSKERHMEALNLAVEGKDWSRKGKKEGASEEDKKRSKWKDVLPYAAISGSSMIEGVVSKQIQEAGAVGDGGIQEGGGMGNAPQLDTQALARNRRAQESLEKQQKDLEKSHKELDELRNNGAEEGVIKAREAELTRQQEKLDRQMDEYDNYGTMPDQYGNYNGGYYGNDYNSGIQYDNSISVY